MFCERFILHVTTVLVFYFIRLSSLTDIGFGNCGNGYSYQATTKCIADALFSLQ